MSEVEVLIKEANQEIEKLKQEIKEKEMLVNLLIENLEQ